MGLRLYETYVLMATNPAGRGNSRFWHCFRIRRCDCDVIHVSQDISWQALIQLQMSSIIDNLDPSYPETNIPRMLKRNRIPTKPRRT
jgi:hypothetical protein